MHEAPGGDASVILARTVAVADVGGEAPLLVLSHSPTEECEVVIEGSFVADFPRAGELCLCTRQEERDEGSEEGEDWREDVHAGRSKWWLDMEV